VAPAESDAFAFHQAGDASAVDWLHRQDYAILRGVAREFS
jgi:hypothetical protein